MKRLVLCALAAVLATTAATAQQDYPKRPIRLVVPFSAGGNTDVGARLLANGLADVIGQQVIVENKVGAGATIGTDVVAKAAPDGYTLLFTTLAHSANPSIYAKLPYDGAKDFQPVAMVSINDFVLVTNPDIEARDVDALIALLKQRPGRLDYSSAGVGSAMHLAGELFKSVARVDAVHVPYRGEGPALNDLLGKRISFSFHGVSTTADHIKGGTVRALAVTGPTRSPLLPEIPTMKEAGLPNYEAYTWSVVLAPAGTPREIVNRLNVAINAVVRQPRMQQRFTELGFQVVTDSTPESTAEHIRREEDKWAPIIKASGIRPN
jgi:tripartite-type tricarboxylate transporter receptor subunit TctC